VIDWVFGYNSPIWRGVVGICALAVLFIAGVFSVVSTVGYYGAKHSCAVTADAAGVDTKWAGPNVWADCYVRTGDDTWVTIDKWRGQVED